MLAILSLILMLSAVILSGWFPFFYRRFTRDRKGRVVGRALLWSFSLIILAFFVAMATERLPLPGIYPLAVLVLPLPLNIIALIRYARHNA